MHDFHSLKISAIERNLPHFFRPPCILSILRHSCTTCIYYLISVVFSFVLHVASWCRDCDSYLRKMFKVENINIKEKPVNCVFMNKYYVVLNTLYWFYWAEFVIVSRDCSKSFWRLYCSAMLCISAAYAVMRCLCICVSVTFKTNKHINIFHRWVDFHSSFSFPNGIAIFWREPP